MGIQVKPAEIRQARAYLQKQGIRSADISPAHFVAVAKETGKSYHDTLLFLAHLLSGGQGEGPSPVTTANVDRLDPIRALGQPSPEESAEYDATTS